MESIRLGGPAHGIVTKTVHKTLPGGGGGPGGKYGWWGSRWWVGRGGGWVGVVGVQGWVGTGWWGVTGGLGRSVWVWVVGYMDSVGRVGGGPGVGG